ncbi:hypothetical protein [Prevotella brunnea]|uniref:hypothetical protein n=1 Tax=Prevotella brunnea TaxID=2508867 RepID=UPI00283A946C|nr:hypothetical protein [Prevotella brunnea]
MGKDKEILTAMRHREIPMTVWGENKSFMLQNYEKNGRKGIINKLIGHIRHKYLPLHTSLRRKAENKRYDDKPRVYI